MNVWRQQRMVTCGTRRRRPESGVLTPRFSGNLTGLGFHAAHRIASCYPWPAPPPVKRKVLGRSKQPAGGT